MSTEPFIVIGFGVSLAYGVGWFMIPSKNKPCRQCQGKVYRIHRKTWQRFLSLLYPICNTRCGKCSKEKIRRVSFFSGN